MTGLLLPYSAVFMGLGPVQSTNKESNESIPKICCSHISLHHILFKNYNFVLNLLYIICNTVCVVKRKLGNRGKCFNVFSAHIIDLFVSLWANLLKLDHRKFFLVEQFFF